jgi:hypothetical protein
MRMTDVLTPLHKPIFDPPPGSEEFYAECLSVLARSGIPFVVSGTYAISCYTGITRPTKDVDVFARPGDAMNILSFFREEGFDVEVVDERWLCRVVREGLFMDVIFNMPTAGVPVSDSWFEGAPEATIYDTRVKLVPPTEMVWSKVYVQDRHRYDGADVAHLILKRHNEIDWKRLLAHMELHWEVLLIAILNFRFIYPSERHLIPHWLFEELTRRLAAQEEMPPPSVKICRGRIFSPRDYHPDVTAWGFSEPFGNLEERYERK